MSRNELEDRIYALLDGELDQKQLDQLEEDILAHPEGLAIYRGCSRLHTVLKVSTRSRKSVEAWNVVPIDRINAIERKRWFTHSVAAALVALLCVVSILWWRISENRPLRHAYGTSDGAIYSVTHPPGHKSDQPGTLIEGSRLVLESGTVECWLQQGVRAVLQAPCDLTVTGDNGITLGQGTGYFHIAKGAEGFTVTTPELVAVDLGTQFGVLSAPGMNDEVHVFSGKVRVSSRAPLRQTTELTAGKSIHTDAAGRLKAHAQNSPNLFVSLSKEKHKPQPTNMKNKIVNTAVIAALGTGFSHAAVNAFSQDFYSTNTGLTSPSNNVVWTTPTFANAEMHTSFTTSSIAVGQTLRVSFNIAFNEPEGDGGNNDLDGIRFGLLDLTTQTNADGPHATTTASGSSTRFNWTTGTEVTGGSIRSRGVDGGTSPNYVTTTSVYDDPPNNINGFGLLANGTAYDARYEATRINATDVRYDFTINGRTRSFTDTGADAFSYDTFALAKIGNDITGNGPDFQQSSTFTFSSFAVAVVPEPSGIMLIGCSAVGFLLRRRR